MIEAGLVFIGLAGFFSYVTRGITGGASAIVFNAVYGLGLALGLVGGLTLIDGLVWIAMGDLVGSLVLLVVLRRDIRLEPFLVRILLASVPTAIVFTWLLPRVDARLLAAGLGLVLIAAAAYLALRAELRPWAEARLVRWSWPVGLGAGVLSGLYGMPGPLLIVFLSHAGGDQSRFRARITLLSATWTSFRAVTLVTAGTLAAVDVGRFVLTVPLILAGLAVGVWLHPRVSPLAFRRLLALLVGLSGVVLTLRFAFP